MVAIHLTQVESLQAMRPTEVATSFPDGLPEACNNLFGNDLRLRNLSEPDTQFVDKAIERIHRTLEDTGHLSDTVVLMTGDHGDMIRPIRPYALPRSMSLYEEIIRVPLIVRIPPHWRDSNLCKYLQHNSVLQVSNIDIVPTIIDLIGADNTPHNGKLRKLLIGSSLLEPLPDNRWIIAAASTDIRQWKHEGFALVCSDRRFVFSDVHKGQLFDTDQDPLQLTDIWGSISDHERDLLLGIIRDNEFMNTVYTRWSGLRANDPPSRGGHGVQDHLEELQCNLMDAAAELLKERYGLDVLPLDELKSGLGRSPPAAAK